jgi:hypothetical protein
MKLTQAIRQRGRRTLRQYGVDLTYQQVICAEHVKTIRIDEDWRTDVTVQRALVFLEDPEPGDLYDVMPVNPEADPDTVIQESPDAVEIGRRQKGHSTVVYWNPRERLVPYSLYIHQHGWTAPGVSGQAALYTEFRCEVRTGLFALEMIAPMTFETAVAFRCSPGRRLSTEHSIVKHALQHLEAPNRPLITDDGQRVEWRIAGPAIGDRYICVMFGPDGVAQWQKRLEHTSLLSRVQELVRSVVPS